MPDAPHPSPVDPAEVREGIDKLLAAECFWDLDPPEEAHCVWCAARVGLASLSAPVPPEPHDGWQVYQEGEHWFARCACGWLSLAFTDADAAERSWQDHFNAIIIDALADYLPRLIPADEIRWVAAVPPADTSTEGGES